MQVIEVNCATGEQTTRDMTAEELAAISNTPQPTPDPKMTGVEFDGVMCSATRDDQNGLMAVLMAKQLQGAAFQPTRFHFANGNSLVMTKENIADFAAVWMPFRQSFFAPATV